MPPLNLRIEFAVSVKGADPETWDTFDLLAEAVAACWAEGGETVVARIVSAWT